MAELNPDHRASAAQMLVTRFNGKGLNTPINRIPPILDQVTLVTPQPVAGLTEAPFTPSAPQIAGPPTKAKVKVPRAELTTTASAEAVQVTSAGDTARGTKQVGA